MKIRIALQKIEYQISNSASIVYLCSRNGNSLWIIWNMNQLSLYIAIHSTKDKIKVRNWRRSLPSQRITYSIIYYLSFNLSPNSELEIQPYKNITFHYQYHCSFSEPAPNGRVQPAWKARYFQPLGKVPTWMDRTRFSSSAATRC